MLGNEFSKEKEYHFTDLKMKTCKNKISCQKTSDTLIGVNPIQPLILPTQPDFSYQTKLSLLVQT